MDNRHRKIVITALALAAIYLLFSRLAGWIFHDVEMHAVLKYSKITIGLLFIIISFLIYLKPNKKKHGS